ncbi:dynamin family protein [Thiogranum longum]|uniref:Dynamin family protein n=1 Tax=Thiogranum longum TaxID=1537524 RepID=A0A4V2PGX7_9GAMM|nr:dynamin family protein [Thiogranum longum]TCK18526.1 dynamin family protein [Thiogranum longum]
MRPDKSIRKRLKSLELHLKEENPILVSAVDGFRQLSRVGYAMGLLDRSESYATRISWWPLISVLGTFSSGKSTFINQYLSYPLQDTGNQAVDDKFTVICYGGDNDARTLPGLALDADPRFPFYQTSEELEKVENGQGRRIDAYLQLKTCNSEKLKGRILIDSPGFDADEQRSATLRLTNHIIDLSDLVLVFFDARHPEPGAMSDTLAHLVGATKDRADSSKFLYILNQIDTTAREDNPEEVIGAWQRALAREGLTAGRFYTIYDQEASVPIENESLRRRFEWKRDQDLSEILNRVEQVSVERAYRIVGALEKRVREIEDYYVPHIRKLIVRWRRQVLIRDAGWLLLVGLAVVGSRFLPQDMKSMLDNSVQQVMTEPTMMLGAGTLLVIIALFLHFRARRSAAASVIDSIQRRYVGEECECLKRAFKRNTGVLHSIFSPDPVGWSRRNRRTLKSLVSSANRLVQTLNDRFTDPSGKRPGSPKVEEVQAEAVAGEVLPKEETA